MEHQQIEGTDTPRDLPPRPEAPRPFTCSHCGAQASAQRRHCPACEWDLGAPNVRECTSEAENRTLNARANAAHTLSDTKGCSDESRSFASLLENESGVVVTMPAAIARDLASDPKKVFTNYERLTSSDVRLPASTHDDKRRRGVTGILFGSYADNIRYGVLSLTREGLSTYGAIHCRLKAIAVAHRVSFLEDNSFTFVERHNITPGSGGPAGYRAIWSTRHLLGIAKLGADVVRGSKAEDWQRLLVCSDSVDRRNDRFIEAHIFGGFNIDAVESMETVPGVKASDSATIDIEIALELFNKKKGIGV